MVLYELWINSVQRDFINVRITWDVNYADLPSWEAQLAYANESVTRGNAVEIKRRNAQDGGHVSIFKGIMEYKKPKMSNTGHRVMVVGGRHEGIKLWRKWNERNSDMFGFWTDYYPHKIIEFITRPTRSPKPSIVQDRLYGQVGWGINPKDVASMWVMDSSGATGGSNAQNVSDRNNGIGWRSSINQNGKWIEVDLGSTKNIMGIRVENREDKNYFRGYEIKTSTTGAFGGEEVTVATKAANHARNIVESWTPANTRYIRIYGTVTTSFEVFVGEIYVYDSSDTISGISIGTLNEYLPLNCSEITENATSGQSYVKVRHSHRYRINDDILIFDGTGNEVEKEITSIDGGTNQLNFSGGIGFAVDIVNDPWVANIETIHSHEINIDYKRRTEVIDKIAKFCIAPTNEAWEWWITDAGAVNFASQRGSDVSGSVAFDYASEIMDSEHDLDDRKAIDSVLVLPRSGKDPNDQDLNSSGWQGTGDYEEVVWDSDIDTEEAAISKALSILEQSTLNVDHISIEVDDNEVATGTWEVGDTVEINDTATGISGDYRVVKVQRRYSEGGESVTIQANSKKFSITDAIFGISKNVRDGMMQQVYDEQWRSLGATSVPEYVLFYEAELLTFDPVTTDKILDKDAHGGAYIERTSAKATADMMWGPGLTLNAGLYRVRFWCKVADNSSGSTVATLKVYSADYGGNFETYDLAPADFAASDAWQGFTFLFTTEEEYTDIQLIISFTTGVTDFACDWTAIMVGGTDTLADIDLDFPAGAPATPTGLSATSKPLGGLLEWDTNTEQDLSHYEVYKHTSNDSGSATKIADVMSNWFFYVCDSGEYGLTRYFWVKAVDWVGNVSPFSTVSSCAMGQVDGIDIALLAIDTGHLQDEAVENAKLDDLAVTGAKIAVDTINANKIKSGAQNFNSDIIYVPKVADTHDSVTYSSGTITFVDGGTISITGADLDNFSNGWSWISAQVGVTSLSAESNPDFLADDIIIVAAVFVSTEAITQEIAIFPIGSQGWNIIADNIAANSILADKVATNQLSAQHLVVYSVLLDSPGFNLQTSHLYWNSHDLQYEGVNYTIAAGNTSSHGVSNPIWVWWDEGDSAFTTGITRPDIQGDQTLHPVAVFDNTNDKWWEVWKPTVIHGGAIVAETINAEVLVTDFFLANVEMKTGATAQWADGSGGAGVIITDAGIRGKDSSGDMQWEALNTGTEAGMITAGGGTIQLGDFGQYIIGQGLSFYSSTPTLYGYVYGDNTGNRLHIYGSANIRMAALGGGYNGDIELDPASADLFFDGNIIPGVVGTKRDSQYAIGETLYRYLDIWADELHGDVFYTDMNFLPEDFTCVYCNKTFREGDEIVLAVRKFVPHDEYGEVMKAKPVHRSCNRISRISRDWRRKRLDK